MSSTHNPGGVGGSYAPTWLKSSSCSGGSCMEVAKVGDEYLIRDGKNPDLAPLHFSAEEWTAFRKGAVAGEFDF